MSNLFSSSIGKKIAMALSALFLLFFLLQHLVINITSVFSESTFNEVSHFMGTNILVQFLLQPILITGVLFHFIWGFVLTLQNNKARDIEYVKNAANANSSWVSRNMIWSGLFILFFLGFHFYDFWIPEINYKYIQLQPENPTRYYSEVVHMFESHWRVIIYTLSFVFLALHLWHGFQSAFQSIGVKKASSAAAIVSFGKWYSILVPLGFVFIAWYHHLSSF